VGFDIKNGQQSRSEFFNVKLVLMFI